MPKELTAEAIEILAKLEEMGVTPLQAAAEIARLRDGRREHNEHMCEMALLRG